MSVELEYERLLLLRSELRKQLEVVIEIACSYVISIPLEDGKKYLRDMYWWDKELRGSIRDLYEGIFDEKFSATVKIIHVKCSDCNNLCPIKCTSWEKLKYPGRYIRCSVCETLFKEFQKRGIEKSQNREDLRKQEIDHLRSIPYKEYLRTDHWQTLRGQALRRAGYKCQLCGNSGVLHVHHNSYKNRGCEEYRDLIVLCRDCHEKHHDKTHTEIHVVQKDDIKNVAAVSSIMEDIEKLEHYGGY